MSAASAAGRMQLGEDKAERYESSCVASVHAEQGQSGSAALRALRCSSRGLRTFTRTTPRKRDSRSTSASFTGSLARFPGACLARSPRPARGRARTGATTAPGGLCARCSGGRRIGTSESLHTSVERRTVKTRPDAGGWGAMIEFARRRDTLGGGFLCSPRPVQTKTPPRWAALARPRARGLPLPHAVTCAMYSRTARRCSAWLLVCPTPDRSNARFRF